MDVPSDTWLHLFLLDLKLIFYEVYLKLIAALISWLLNAPESTLHEMVIIYYKLFYGIVFQVFLQPMAESGIISMDDIETIFLNWKDLIACNNTFLRALRIRLKMSIDGVVQIIGDILLDYVEFSHFISF